MPIARQERTTPSTVRFASLRQAWAPHGHGGGSSCTGEVVVLHRGTVTENMQPVHAGSAVSHFGRKLATARARQLAREVSPVMQQPVMGQSAGQQCLPPAVLAALVQGQVTQSSMPQPMLPGGGAQTVHMQQPGHGTPSMSHGSPSMGYVGSPASGSPHMTIGDRLNGCYPEWSTGSKDNDEWLAANMQDNAVFKQLTQVSMTERKQLVTAIMGRQDGILNVTKYMMGCLKRSSHSPMGAPGAMAPRAAVSSQVLDVARPWRRESSAMQAAPATQYQQRPAPSTPSLQHQPAILPGTSNFMPAQQLQPCLQPSLAPAPPLPASQGSSAPAMPADPPEWVRDAVVDIARPSSFVGKVRSQLPPAQQTIVSGLQPMDQQRICFALVLQRASWADPGSAMEELLRTYGQLLPEHGIGSQLAATKKELRLVVLHCCSGIGTSHIIIQGAMRIMATARPDVHCSVSESYAFEVDPDCLQVERAMLQELGSSCAQMGSVEQLPFLVQQNCDRWLQMNVVICFLNSWPCKNTSKAAAMRNRPDGSGLHMQHSRRMWDIDHARYKLVELGFPENKIAHFTEYPQCGNTGEEETVDRLFGKPFVSNPSSYHAANRARNLRTSPKGLIVKKYHHPIDPFAAVGSWQWCGNAGSDEKYPLVTLRSFIVTLIEVKLFGSRDLEPYEELTLKRCMMEHVETKETAYISRAFWLLWLGFDKTPISGITTKLFPCLVNIDTASGAVAMQGASGTSACGKDRYCNNCERVMQMLGQAWHVQSMTDVAVAWLDRIAAAHCSGDATVVWPGRPDESPHVCGPSCAHNPNPGV